MVLMTPSVFMVYILKISMSKKADTDSIDCAVTVELNRHSVGGAP